MVQRYALYLYHANILTLKLTKGLRFGKLLNVDKNIKY